jgi:hypothetical protein
MIVHLDNTEEVVLDYSLICKSVPGNGERNILKLIGK